MNIAEKYEVDATDHEVFGFLLPYLEKEQTEFLIVLFYIDETNWEGEINSWKDKIIFKMFSDLDKVQRGEVLLYIEENNND